MSRKKKPGDNTSVAVVFLVLILCAAFLSFFVKIFFVIKQSQFRQGNNFSIYISNGRENEIAVFNKDNTITIFKIDEKAADIYKFSEVPVNSFSVGESIRLDGQFSETISDVVFGIAKTKNNLNSVDRIRMFIMAKTINPRSVSEKRISMGSAEDQRDRMFASVFSDPKIEEEDLGVEIINKSEESGVGNRIARLVSNMGGNTILVSTGEEDRNSAIYAEGDSYTVRRLSEVLNYPIIEGKMSRIGEVTIVVGKNYKDLSRY